MQLTCRVGTQTMQNFVSRLDMLTIDCVVPYVLIVVDQDPFLIDLTVSVLSLTPEMAFMDAIDVEVLVKVEPIFNLTTLLCRLHDIPIQGYYVVSDTGEELVSCTIPSIQFMMVESILGFPESKGFNLEISLNSVDFSSDGV